MKEFWQSVKKIWKRLWQTQSDSPSHERDYIKEIEQAIEVFRLMNLEEQFKNFIPVSIFIENLLAEGGFDNKIQIKYFTRFVKIIKTKIFTPRGEVAKHIELDSVYLKAMSQVRRFINELRGVERIKEDRFLNILNHENKVIFNSALMSSVAFFRKIIDELNDQKFTLDKFENFATKIGDIFMTKEDRIKEIIGEALKKIAEQDKINKLKIASDIFKNKAKKYRSNSRWFLTSAVLLPLAFFSFIFFQKFFEFDIFEYDIKFPQETNADSSAFYIYLILEILFRGRLLFSIIVLTGFFYCLRFYAASNHNAIICDQRANTLESFEALYENVGKGKKGEEEKLEVVKKVLNSATEHLPTGFSKQQSDSGGEGIVSSFASLLKR